MKCVQLTKFLQMNPPITSISDQKHFLCISFLRSESINSSKTKLSPSLKLSARALTLIIVKVFVVLHVCIIVLWNVSLLEGLVCWFFWQRTCFKICDHGAPGWLSQLSIQLRLRSWSHGSWLQAMVQVGLCADSLDPRACFRFSVSLSPCPSSAYALFLSASKINIKNFF